MLYDLKWQNHLHPWQHYHIAFCSPLNVGPNHTKGQMQDLLSVHGISLEWEAAGAIMNYD